MVYQTFDVAGLFNAKHHFLRNYFLFKWIDMSDLAN